MCVVGFILPLKPVEGNIKRYRHYCLLSVNVALICSRKLLAVDYLGAGLTLVGCTLVILPLIWVYNFIMYHVLFSTDRSLGRRDFPVEICGRTGTLILRIPCHRIILYLGMERSQIADRSK